MAVSSEGLEGEVQTGSPARRGRNVAGTVKVTGSAGSVRSDVRFRRRSVSNVACEGSRARAARKDAGNTIYI